MKKSIFLIQGLIFLFLFHIASASALTLTPFYSYSDYDGQGGSINSTLDASIEHGSQEGAGTTSVAGGQPWWASDGQSVSISGISSQGWGEVTSDPQSGAIHSRSGAHHTDTNGLSVEYQVTMDIDPYPVTFINEPPDWGKGASYGYIRALWEVGTDGSLSTGDSVELMGWLNVSGEFSGENFMDMRAVMMVNRVEDAFWLDNREYIDNSILEDVILPDTVAIDNMLWFLNYYRDSGMTDTDDEVNINSSSTIEANVGDIILMEAILKTSAVLPNDGTGRDIWAEFGNTLESSLIANTQGVVLIPYFGDNDDNGNNAPVPEPATLFLLGAGFLGIGVLRRRHRD